VDATAATLIDYTLGLRYQDLPATTVERLRHLEDVGDLLAAFQRT
jgi:hypothetical protein